MFEGLSGPELRSAVRRLVGRAATAAPVAAPRPVARLRALAQAQKYVGVKERGGNNNGPMVDAFTRADGLGGEDYAWCQSFQNACWRLATGGKMIREIKEGVPFGVEYRIEGGKMLANGTASVGHFVAWCRAKGLIAERPAPGDHVAFLFSADSWPDHVGIIEKVIQFGPVCILQTIEGNTSSGDAGSQDDGGGVYRRRRVMRRSKLIFARVST